MTKEIEILLTELINSFVEEKPIIYKNYIARQIITNHWEEIEKMYDKREIKITLEYCCDYPIIYNKPLRDAVEFIELKINNKMLDDILALKEDF